MEDHHKGARALKWIKIEVSLWTQLKKIKNEEKSARLKTQKGSLRKK